MNCEIEFLPVGEASKGGDAIIVRYGYERDYRLMLIDGGHTATGKMVVEHLRRWHGDEARLEHVLLTHSDADHASGLRTVLEEVPVANLWLHVPWLRAEPSLFLDAKWTADGLRKRIKDDYDIISEILDLAAANGSNIYEPFAGGQIGPFQILSPSLRQYTYLVPQFDRTPPPNQAVIEPTGYWIGKESLAAKLFGLAKAAIQNWTTETWSHERLRDGGVTSASNESSVVLYGSFDEGPALLTGDAGVRGLSWAAHEADRLGLPLQRFDFVQVPHHGSRRNIGPAILNRLLGNAIPEGSAVRLNAFVSSPAVEDDHPRLIVLNAFKRRGARVTKTNGTNKVYWGGFRARDGYNPAPEVPFSSVVEEYD